MAQRFSSLPLPADVQVQVAYPALDPGRDQIRLLELSPGRAGQPIRGSYLLVSLSSNSSNSSSNVKYQTLSYVWGPAGNAENILIDDVPRHVSQTVFAALHRIRDATQPTRLWIDAVCINQADAAEKTWQVDLMHRIFDQSSRCLVWLGEVPPGEGDLSQEHAEQSAQAAFDAIRVMADIDDEMELPASLRTPEGQLAAGKSLAKLMKSPWWSRIWTVQEAIVSRRTRVLWGPLSIPWSLLRLAADNLCSDKWRDLWGLDWYALFPEDEDSAAFTSPIMSLDVSSLLADSTPHAALDLLWRFRHRDAADPRDKVFAVLKLVPSAKSLLPSVKSADYSLDVATLFKRVTLDLIRDVRDPDNGDDERGLRPLIGLRGEPKRIPNLPSWAIDWSRPEYGKAQFRLHNQVTTRFAADRGLPMLNRDALTAKDDNDAVLHLNGVYFDHVVACTSPISEHDNEDDVRSMWQELVLEYQMQKMTLESLPEAAEWDSRFKALVNGGFIGEPGGLDELHDGGELDDLLLNQTLFITDTGKIGLGPSTTKLYDEAWILSGGRHPFLVRPRSQSFTERSLDHGGAADFELVGDAFIPGFMTGEAVEGRAHKRRFVRLH